jgi:hypothetical protein
MQSVFSAASRRTNSQGEKKGSGRDGALKTDWTKPWHGAASYGDRMAPAMVSRDRRAAWSAGFEAQAAIMESAPDWLCAGGGTRRVREALLVGSAARSSGGLVAASGPSKALGAAVGVLGRQLTCGDRIPEAPIQLEIDWCPPISERLQITQIHVDVPFEETFLAPVN